MRLSKKILMAGGAMVALSGFMVFGFGTGTSIGLETDVEPDSEAHEVTLGVPGSTFGAGQDVEVTVNVLDEDGLPVEGASCTFSIVSQPGTDATVDAGPAATDAQGNATTTLNVGSTAGEVVVGADCDGISRTLSVNVDGGSGTTASPPASLPDTGTGYAESVGLTRTVLVGLLAGFGLVLAIAGLLIGRLERRQDEA